MKPNTEDLKKLHQLQTGILANLKDMKTGLKEIRTDIVEILADSVAFEAGLTDVKTTIQAFNGRNSLHLQKSAVTDVK